MSMSSIFTACDACWCCCLAQDLESANAYNSDDDEAAGTSALPKAQMVAMPSTELQATAIHKSPSSAGVGPVEPGPLPVRHDRQ